MPDRLAAKFKRFYRDTWVAETLVDFAISGKEPPLDDLRRRYAAVGNDPNDLPMDLGEAMELLVYEVADRVTKEASRAGSPLANLVVVRQLGELRANQEGLARRLDLRNETDTWATERIWALAPTLADAKNAGLDVPGRTELVVIDRYGRRSVLTGVDLVEVTN